jgi:hypothetical protein
MHSRITKKKGTASVLFILLVVAVASATWGQGASPTSVVTQVLGAQSVQADVSTSKVNGNGNEPKGAFIVGGDANGSLYPGLVVPLPLHLTNPNSFGILVTEVSVTVTSPKVGCPSGAVEAGVADSNGDFKAQNRIPVSVNLAKNAVNVPLSDKVKLRMTTASPDSCQGVAFNLAYSGSAVKS